MIGIVIPAHNEEELIENCVAHARACVHRQGLSGEPVEVVVVVDACTDATAVLAAKAGALTLLVDARNVGVARAAGAEFMLARGARWLAFTDADTLVSPDWLTDQLALDADAVCGTVEVSDWSPHAEHAQLLSRHFAETYRDADDHRHVHGANLGISAVAYLRAGGFQPLACSEDVDLIASLERIGANIRWSARPRVCTSARRVARASGGFADALLHAIAQRLHGLASTAA
ncbi:glycosyltransferase [Variovorax ginsengisoli]|uniref:Glycosyltransferase involved in cell wall biosynthesis n=1 Tax=Variovorax ginsengisoli TaxID=363844 RepID=A0ABT9SG62_9BURK|nr:glycosyltransferase [Variovorax ginsengisoli]MDP9902372.1 glycosyltransferase involved in cell wall biosynthesis [Variovorax ginsengisoli]